MEDPPGPLGAAEQLAGRAAQNPYDRAHGNRRSPAGGCGAVRGRDAVGARSDVAAVPGARAAAAQRGGSGRGDPAARDPRGAADRRGGRVRRRDRARARSRRRGAGAGLWRATATPVRRRSTSPGLWTACAPPSPGCRSASNRRRRCARRVRSTPRRRRQARRSPGMAPTCWPGASADPHALQHRRPGGSGPRHRAGGASPSWLDRGSLEEVLATESRPLLQGARLTVYELARLGIAHRAARRLGGRRPDRAR